MTKAIPQFEFPKFDSKNPKLWQKQCESYFDVYAIHPNMWVKLGIMNFVGSAAVWSQSVETILQRATWPELCATICQRFERDQQSHLNRQFFRLKQTSIVSSYIEQFDDLIHQILAYDPNFNPHVIISCFIDGLQDNI